MSKILTAAEIDAAADFTVERVPTPEWGGAACVRGWDADARDAWEAEQLRLADEGKKAGQAYGDLRSFKARVLTRCICDEQGKLLYTPEDAPRLGRRNGAVIDRLYTVARRLCGLDAEEEAKILGNFGGGLSAASGSDSPSPSASP